MSEPAVSVIIPALNMGHFLGFALSSIERQRERNLEVVIADAGSNDATEAVVDLHRRNGLDVRLVGGSAMSPAAARNVGIQLSKGNLIAFLDADDLWPEGKLERQLGRLAAKPSIHMVSGYVTYFEIADESGLDPAANSRTETLFHVHVGACIYRREVFDRIGGAFDEGFLYSEDVDLMLRVREHDIPFSILRSVELYYRVHPSSLMSQSDPRKDACFRLAAHKSLARRRAAGKLGKPLPDFANFVEPSP
jgi:glycosyltransferase involved in cell wall biosynthesis